MNRTLTRSLVYLFGISLAANAVAWDPWGDVTHPGRIIENAKREGGNAVRTVGDAVQKAAPVIATIACPGCAILTSALPADQQILVRTIVEKGMVISTLGTVTGLYYLTVMDARNGDVHQDDVPVQIIDVPPTPKRYTADLGDSACMTQLSNGVIQIYAKAPPSFWSAFKAGDIVTAKANVCQEYNSLQGVKSITSAVFKITGASINQLVDEGQGYRYLVVGTPAVA